MEVTWSHPLGQGRERVWEGEEGEWGDVLVVTVHGCPSVVYMRARTYREIILTHIHRADRADRLTDRHRGTEDRQAYIPKGKGSKRNGEITPRIHRQAG